MNNISGNDEILIPDILKNGQVVSVFSETSRQALGLANRLLNNYLNFYAEIKRPKLESEYFISCQASESMEPRIHSPVCFTARVGITLHFTHANYSTSFSPPKFTFHSRSDVSQSFLRSQKFLS